MKRIFLILIGISTQLALFAQRGRVMPEDYASYPDYPSYSSDEGSFIFPLIILILIVVGVIWFKSALNSSRNEEIRNKTLYQTNTNLRAFVDVRRIVNNNNIYAHNPSTFFENENGIINIPKYAKCIILEYYSENRSYVKVKFEDYPQPLYVARWLLRTPEALREEEAKKATTSY